MTLQTSLLVIPPANVQAFAAPLRKKYAAKSYAHGPAHLTLFYPFVPYELIQTALPLLRSIAMGVEPFLLTLDHYGSFSVAQFLAPADPEPFIALFEKVAAVFPEIKPFEGKFGNSIVPHLTLTNLEPDAQIELPPTPVFTFPVDRLFLYSGLEDEGVPWIPEAIFPLGANE
jgi:2'-5' RNA ligase